MCDQCPPRKGDARASRRTFFRLAAAAAAGLLLPNWTKAAPPSAPPKPGNVVSPQEALERLMAGNARYVRGTMQKHDFQAERPALALGQNPFAGVLSCADSRIAPEYAFDTGRGDLFVCRVAGNFADTDGIASLEYAVAVLNTPLILVLGHERCGAVDSTIKAVNDGVEFPGHIPSLVKALRPAVKAANDLPGNLLDNAITQNVLQNVVKLQKASPILDKAVSEGRLKIHGGIYHLADGKVSVIV